LACRARPRRHRPTRADVVEAIELREGLRAALRTDDADTPALDALTARFPLRLGFGGGTPALEPIERGTRGALGAIVAAATRCTIDGSWARVKICRTDSCEWAFYDTTRNRSRTWCSMDSCGNREKTRHYRSASVKTGDGDRGVSVRL